MSSETLRGARILRTKVKSLRLHVRLDELGTILVVRFLNLVVREALLPLTKQRAELIVGCLDTLLVPRGRAVRLKTEAVLDRLVGRSNVPRVLDLGQLFLLKFS